MYLENRRYGQVIGNSAAPYINGTLTAQCGVATHAFAATHTSAANYLALSAGQFPSSAPPGCGTVTACSSAQPSIYRQMAAAGLGWRDYVEGASTNCDQTSDSGVTKIGHDPGLFYTNVNCADDVVPGGSFDQPDNGAFWSALNGNSLRGFSWLSPDQDHVGENSATIAAQDNFLSNFLPSFVASAAYQSGTTALVITYDEGQGNDASAGQDCTDQTADLAGQQPSCHVPLWVVYPYNPGVNDGTFFDHYSVTKAVEDVFGQPYLGHAADSDTNSLVGHFGLAAGS